MKPDQAPPYFRGTQYIGSFPSIDDCPNTGVIPQIAFTGRSNSGKSSLISALCDHRNLAKSSSAPGKTRTLNYFLVPDSNAPPHGLYLVDLPGYGFAKIPKNERSRLRAMVDRFLAEAQNMLLLVIVLDARRKLEEEEENIVRYCREFDQPFVFARTKWDKLNTKERGKALNDWKAAGLADVSIALSSVKKNAGIVKMLDLVRGKLG